MSAGDDNRPQDLRIWYDLRRLPFSQDLRGDDIFLRPCMAEISDGVRFCVQNGMYYAVIGDVGAGKSTSLRYALGRLPKKQFHVMQMTGGSWSFTEMLRSCMLCMGIATRTSQQTTMLRQINDGYRSLRENGMVPVLFIDEAHLFQQDVFNQLHLLSQPDLDSGKVTPIVLCGQDLLFERLRSPFCRPLMSRVMDGFNLHGMSCDEFAHYMAHHIRICGGREGLFEDNALTAIFQISAGLPRRVNEISLMAMKEAMARSEHSVTLEAVRVVTKNWWEN